MICPNCGNQIADNSTFCPVCGGNVSASYNAQPQPQQPQYTAPQQPQYTQPQQPQYGQQYAGQQYGQPQYNGQPYGQPYAQPVPPMPPAPAKKPNKAITIIAIVVAALVVLGVIGTVAENAFMSTDQKIEAWIDDSGRSYANSYDNDLLDCEIFARDDSLVFSYQYKTDLIDEKATGEMLQKSLNNYSSTYKNTYDSLKRDVPGAKSVIIEYLNKNGKVIASKEYK